MLAVLGLAELVTKASQQVRGEGVANNRVLLAVGTGSTEHEQATRVQLLTRPGTRCGLAGHPPRSPSFPEALR